MFCIKRNIIAKVHSFVAIEKVQILTMLKLFSLKNQKKDGAEGGSKPSGQRKSSAAMLRITKGMELNS